MEMLGMDKSEKGRRGYCESMDGWMPEWDRQATGSDADKLGTDKSYQSQISILRGGVHRFVRIQLPAMC